MTQERVIAQVQPRLQHCLEQRDRPGILALTTWLVHRHGHPLLQQLLSQPQWSSHRLWWGKQISHPNPDPQPQPCPKTTPTAKDDHRDDKASHKPKTPMAAQDTSDPWEEQTPAPRQHPEPEDGLRPDGHSAHPASRTASSDQDPDPIKLTPAQVTKQRLKMGKSAKPVPIQKESGTAPAMTQAVNKEQPQRRPPKRLHRSLQLRDWLPCSDLPHQLPRQDAA